MIDLLAQIGILIFGMGAVILAAFTDKKIRRWAYICGVLATPFWMITLVHHQQWLVLFAQIGYTVAWGLGFYSHWIKKEGK